MSLLLTLSTVILFIYFFIANYGKILPAGHFLSFQGFWPDHVGKISLNKNISAHSQRAFVQSQQQKQQNSQWNLFKVSNRCTGTTALMSCCCLWTFFTHCSGVSIVDFEQVNPVCVTINHNSEIIPWLSVFNI